MTKSVVDVHIYTVNSSSVNSSIILPCDNTSIVGYNCTSYTEVGYGIGQLAALISTAAWLIFASLMMLPVSVTQSTVGATVGFSLVLKGSAGINWTTIIKIAISWVTSPLLSGLTSVIFYIVVKYTVLKRDDQFEWSLKMMPFYYWFALIINIFAIVYEGSKYLYFDRLAWYSCLAISFGIATMVAIFVWFLGRHWVRKRVLSLEEKSKLSANIRAAEANASSKGNRNSAVTDSFGNSVGALVGIWVLFQKNYVGGELAEDGSLEYLTIFGALSMVLGLWCLGHKVIKTLGENLTEVTAPSGFCMELGTAFTVLFASKLGIPISTTHCAVGAIVAVGWFKSEKGGISWSMFKNIAIAWLVTLPVCGAVSALIAYLLMFIFK